MPKLLLLTKQARCRHVQGKNYNLKKGLRGRLHLKCGLRTSTFSQGLMLDMCTSTQILHFYFANKSTSINQSLEQCVLNKMYAVIAAIMFCLTFGYVFLSSK